MSERQLYVSSGAFTATGLEAVLDQAAEIGVAAIELSSGMPHRPDVMDVVARHHDRFRFLVHNYFPAPADPFVLNLAATDPGVLARSRDHVRRGLALTAALGAPFYAVHAGFMMQPQVNELGRPFGDAPVAPREKAWAIFLDSVREATAEARRLGVRFLVENNVLAPFNAPGGRNDRLLLVDPDEMLLFARAADDPAFGYLIDVGHLKVSARTLGFDLESAMAAVAPLTAAFHLSDNDGLSDSNRPFEDDAWFAPWLSRCPAADVVIEVTRCSAAEIAGCLARARAWMKEEA